MTNPKLDGFLISKPENIFYQSGFKGTFGYLLIKNKQKILITDSRYELVAKKMCYKDVEIRIVSDFKIDIVEIVKKLKIKTIGFEDSHLTYNGFRKFRKTLSDVDFKPLSNELDKQRMIKTTDELKLIRKSQEINEKTLSRILRFLKPGVSEKEIAWKIFLIGHDLGAEGTSFNPIVAFGENSAAPHHSPTSDKLKTGQIALIDMGMKYEGYCSDMSRTFLPKKPTRQQTKDYLAVLSAQKECIVNLHAGHKASYGDKLSRKVLEKLNLAEFFTHANGHGVGLEIHEPPSLSSLSKHSDRNIELESGMVVTVEPGIYFEGEHGIRIEDMILIGNKRNTNLTKFEKELKQICILR